MWQVVEIGKGSKVKYELDKASGLIKVCSPTLLLFVFILNLSSNGYLLRSLTYSKTCFISLFKVARFDGFSFRKSKGRIDVFCLNLMNNFSKSHDLLYAILRFRTP